MYFVTKHDMFLLYFLLKHGMIFIDLCIILTHYKCARVGFYCLLVLIVIGTSYKLARTGPELYKFSDNPKSHIFITAVGIIK